MNHTSTTLRDHTLRALICLSLGATALGCGPRFSPVASHTLTAGENNDHDIVWISDRGERVLRCQNSKAGPICTTAQMQ